MRSVLIAMVFMLIVMGAGIAGGLCSWVGLAVYAVLVVGIILRVVLGRRGRSAASDNMGCDASDDAGRASAAPPTDTTSDPGTSEVVGARKSLFHKRWVRSGIKAFLWGFVIGDLLIILFWAMAGRQPENKILTLSNLLLFGLYGAGLAAFVSLLIANDPPAESSDSNAASPLGVSFGQVLFRVLGPAAICLVLALLQGKGCDEAGRQAAQVLSRQPREFPPDYHQRPGFRLYQENIERTRQQVGVLPDRDSVFVAGDSVVAAEDVKSPAGRSLTRGSRGTIRAIGSVTPDAGQFYEVEWDGWPSAESWLIREPHLLPSTHPERERCAADAYRFSILPVPMALAAPDQPQRRQFIWCRRAAQLGHRDAMNSLGQQFLNGVGTPKDYDAAVRWFRRAADLGQPLALTNLGWCYDTGSGVAQDRAEAIRLYRKAAELGESTAMNNLGVCYQHGGGLDQNYAEAVVWYRRAADAGNSFAMANLGVCFANGHGVKQDEAEAVRWYRKAADLGDASALTNLGYAHEYGKGVTADENQAIAWYRKAAVRGQPYAQDALRKRGMTW